MEAKKLAIITSASAPALWEQCEHYICAELGEKGLEIYPYYEEKLLDDIMANGGMNAEFYERSFAIYEHARKDKMDALLVACSTIGEVTKQAKPLYELFGLPIMQMDRVAAMKAVSMGRKIGMVLNLSTTLEPTKRLLEECAKEQGKEIEILVGFKPAFGLSEEEVRQGLINSTLELAKEADVIFLAQASMTKWCDMLQEMTQVPLVPVLTNAAKEVKRVLFGE